MKKSIVQLKDFKQFYIEDIKPHKEANGNSIRLDGRMKGSSRKVFGYFRYKGYKWKVDEDTHFEKLKIAFDIMCKGKEPFIEKPTKNGKGKCLVINGEPKEKKMLYIYKVTSV